MRAPGSDHASSGFDRAAQDALAASKSNEDHVQRQKVGPRCCLRVHERVSLREAIPARLELDRAELDDLRKNQDDAASVLTLLASGSSAGISAPKPDAPTTTPSCVGRLRTTVESAIRGAHCRLGAHRSTTEAAMDVLAGKPMAVEVRWWLADGGVVASRQLIHAAAPLRPPAALIHHRSSTTDGGAKETNKFIK
ncbi:uncharacterized protein ACA1_298530 [Acanthamoeba castellanii str. Neff]|uniref:Uncharacterized protein n=1 Tax=Acanthamoeba castellanii (strain ATCC 30010 / Neff) TaxID=1257118 RepID=L8GE72_ACACF|nr:uncharacterized protein ACA1_298530 [Acanthamoeba castellanii str. Neff]ELR11013.1 hypothetical protein ACA1_298530 [Acanthamoeba castellanii str. Neff]